MHKSHFDVNIQVALTSTLVMYTLFGSVGDKLPDTGYIKMVDIFLIMSLTVPFLEVFQEIVNTAAGNLTF